MYCPNCGVSNPPGATFCNVCGKELPSLSTSVTCPYCGADGQEYQFNCTKCGHELPRERRITPTYTAKTEAAPSSDAAAAGPTATGPAPSEVNACPMCGRPKSIYADKCSYCSDYPSDETYQEPSQTYSSGGSELPRIGGILILIAGVLGVIWGLILLGSVTGYGLPGSATCCPGLMLLFGLVAIAGGVSAMGRGSAIFAIVGAIFGILSIGFFIGALLSFIGLILCAISYKDFEG